MSGRGPQGRAGLPPDWLSENSLPLDEHPAGRPLFRVHRSVNPPVFYSPGSGNPPAGRFDSAEGLFGVLYLALAFEAAFAETVLRNPARRLVSLAEIASRSLAVMELSRPVRLVRMHGAGLQALGVDNAITTGPYEPCGVWADALFTHPDQPDGIAYGSRHDPDHLCVALFSRPGATVTVKDNSVMLTEMLGRVGTILRAYGKGLEP